MDDPERLGDVEPKDSNAPRTSRLALASLIAGFLSFCVPILGSVPAVALGIMGLVRIRRSAGRLLGKGLAIAGLVSGVLSLACWVGLLLALVPAVQKIGRVKEDFAHQQKLRRLTLAMHDYNDTFGQLPPAVVYDASGKPLYGWRVLLLPFLEQGNVYRALKLNEAWDSPHNRPLLEKMPAAFAAPGREAKGDTTTPYQVFVGKDAAFEGRPTPKPFAARQFGLPEGIYLKSGSPRLPASFMDGMANTLLIVQGPEPVPWAAPEDLSFAAEGPAPLLERMAREGFNAAFADASTRRIGPNFDLATLRAIITPAGNEVVSLDPIPPAPPVSRPSPQPPAGGMFK